ncbi:MAG: preprotein translocase subunit SecA, partial [Patescibacteria group bacterium]|nr:preprotein translocase subunit SecA [Patescibacteria group bacterium]
MSGLLSRFFSSNQSAAFAKAAAPVLREIGRVGEELTPLSDDELRARAAAARARLAALPDALDAELPEVFALVREAATRTLGQRHFDVQLMGGLALAAGKIAEMRTGEGKTLVATLSAALHGLAGKGVHVVTVNDYLARRDGAWMGQVYAFLGLSVGVVTS